MAIESPFASLPISRQGLEQLYQSAGHEEGMRRILFDFYERMSRDLLIGFFFEGRDLKQIAERQLSFLLRAIGVTSSYSGKPPAAAHQGLPPILSGHFDRRLKILEETLQAHGLSSEDIRTWLGFENAFRDAIVS